MKKTILIGIILIGMMPFLNAQRQCGTMEYLQSQMLEDPDLEARMQAYEIEIDKWIQSNQDYINSSKSVVQIPVVVHIVYKTSTQNISDLRVFEQIDVLNRDFAGLNTNPMYGFGSALKANTEIQFCLAQQKPDGTATNGIERRQTSVTTFKTNNAVKFYSQGGLDAWDPSRYMNIWVCDLGTSLAGYAQFPTTGINSTFGVVINYRFFGVTGALAPYNLGGTTTHEIGHCFNLYHIWGDDNGACTGSDNCNDTPNQANYNYGVPVFPHVTCNNAPNGDMFMNFMDYTDDIAYSNFTPLQKARMLALTAPGGLLYSLATSNACQPPVTGCNTPSGLSTSSITATEASLVWNAVPGATAYNIQYKETNAAGFIQTSSNTGSYVLNGLNAGTDYEWMVQAVCTGVASGWSAVASFTTSGGAGCLDIYEPNEKTTTAKSIPLNTNIFALISTAADNDYFVFSTTKANAKFKVNLSNLPADYDVKLYKGKTLISVSQNSGTSDETIIYNAKNAATYYVYVYGYSGAYNTSDCYTLNIQTSASNFKGISADDESDTPLNVAMYPNPVSDNLTIDYNSETPGTGVLNIYDISGRVVMSYEVIANKGLNTYSVEMGNFTEGVYLVEMQIENERIVRKIVLNR